MNRHVALCLSILVGLTIPASHALATPDDSAQIDLATRAELRKELAAERKLNLQRFHNYRVKRIYPHNTYQEGKLNVWTDADGHLCAVATLMEVAGLHDLVASTAKEHNFIRVADQSTGDLIDWVLTSGFTQEEVALIQQPSQADVEEYEWQQAVEKRRQARKLAREDDRLEGNYTATEQMLKKRLVADAALDVAVARLAARPELAAALHVRTLARAIAK